jgi:hypothetical protein
MANCARVVIIITVAYFKLFCGVAALLVSVDIALKSLTSLALGLGRFSVKKKGDIA